MGKRGCRSAPSGVFPSTCTNAVTVAPFVHLDGIEPRSGSLAHSFLIDEPLNVEPKGERKPHTELAGEREPQATSTGVPTSTRS
jgi:hypothetical protein